MYYSHVIERGKKTLWGVFITLLWAHIRRFHLHDTITSPQHPPTPATFYCHPMQDWDFKGGVLRGTGIQSTSWELSFNSQAQAQPSSVSYSSWYLFPKGIDHILPPFLVHCGSRKIRIYIFLLTAEAQCLAPTGSRSHILVG